MGSLPTPLENLNSEHNLTLSDNVPVIILGDFNLHIDDRSNLLASDFLDLFFSNDLLLSQLQLLIPTNGPLTPYSRPGPCQWRLPFHYLKHFHSRTTPHIVPVRHLPPDTACVLPSFHRLHTPHVLTYLFIHSRLYSRS